MKNHAYVTDNAVVIIHAETEEEAFEILKGTVVNPEKFRYEGGL